MRAQITAELVAEAKQQADLKIKDIRARCKATDRAGFEKPCTCPNPMPTEDQLIAEHLNFALSVMEPR